MFTILFASLLACAPNDPVELWDGMGEVDVPQTAHLDDIRFDCPPDSAKQLEQCLSLHDDETGVLCNEQDATIAFDRNEWGLAPHEDWAQYDIDTYEQNKPPNVIIVAVRPEDLKRRFAECGCPSGCSAARCEWQENEDGNWVCSGECRGDHCAECTVLLLEEPLESVTPTS